MHAGSPTRLLTFSLHRHPSFFPSFFIPFFFPSIIHSFIPSFINLFVHSCINPFITHSRGYTAALGQQTSNLCWIHTHSWHRTWMGFYRQDGWLGNSFAREAVRYPGNAPGWSPVPIYTCASMSPLLPGRVLSGIPANTRHWPNVVRMLGRRLRRRPSIRSTSRVFWFEKHLHWGGGKLYPHSSYITSITLEFFI